eukprot:3777731-Prymnesium_polylepis.1
MPRSALPASVMIERMSAKSTLMSPGRAMMSEMPMMPCRTEDHARARTLGGRPSPSAAARACVCGARARARTRARRSSRGISPRLA